MSEINDLAEKLKSEGEKTVRFFSELPAEQWGLQIYTEGELWTLRDVLAHFVTAERGLVKLFEQIRTGGAGAAEDFSIDRYNAAQQQKVKALTPAELLTQYQAVRADSIQWTSGLKDEELEFTGRHPFLGVTTLREMIKLLYVHNQTHCRDIKKALN
ncbi:MAG: DinB family protein [Anaerolineales bacterium]|nr:DinB family protein [Anaerolineales bacterium]